MGRIAEICEVDASKLVPYERNAKVHSDAQVEKIAASIKEFGFIAPCIIDRDLNIIAGHGRVLAAKKLGMKKVPCVYAEGLTEEQRRAYILADNKLAELALWDMDTLSIELEDLDALGFDITLAGFSDVSGLLDEYESDYDMTRGLELDEFAVTFNFPKEHEIAIKQYISDNGKDAIVQDIIEKAVGV